MRVVVAELLKDKLVMIPGFVRLSLDVGYRLASVHFLVTEARRRSATPVAFSFFIRPPSRIINSLIMAN